MARLAKLGALLVFCASVAACTLNWDPLQPSSCGGAGQSCCADGGVACQSGFACVSGTCSSACAGPSISCGGACIDVSSSVTNCGACAHACAAGQICNSGTCSTMCSSGQMACGGSCVNVTTSATNCGTCGHSCETAIPHAGATCSAGTCHFVACETGFVDCDGNQSTGCEVNVQTDQHNCGTCGNRCIGMRPCVAGVCQ